MASKYRNIINQELWDVQCCALPHLATSSIHYYISCNAILCMYTQWQGLWRVLSCLCTCLKLLMYYLRFLPASVHMQSSLSHYGHNFKFMINCCCRSSFFATQTQWLMDSNGIILFTMTMGRCDMSVAAFSQTWCLRV